MLCRRLLSQKIMICLKHRNKQHEFKNEIRRKVQENYQGREAVLSSSARNREASMRTGIRSRKGLAEHVRCGWLDICFSILLFTICLCLPFLQLLLNLLHGIIYSKSDSKIGGNQRKAPWKETRRKKYINQQNDTPKLRIKFNSSLDNDF